MGRGWDVYFSLWVGTELLGVLLTSEARMEQKIDKQIGAASAVIQELNWTIVVKRKISQKV